MGKEKKGTFLQTSAASALTLGKKRKKGENSLSFTNYEYRELSVCGNLLV